jgi:hypothetical protein
MTRGVPKAARGYRDKMEKRIREERASISKRVLGSFLKLTQRHEISSDARAFFNVRRANGIAITLNFRVTSKRVDIARRPLVGALM